MAGGPIAKVRPGEPLRIPATAYNRFADAAHFVERLDPDALRQRSLPDGRGHLILVRNDSGEDLPRFGVLGIAGPIIEPADNSDEFKSRPTVAGAAITTTDEYVGRFVVAREPIAAGEIGVAVIRGTTPAIVDVVDEDHGHADTYPGDQHLRSGWTGGARILWQEPGTGEQLAVIDVGPTDHDRFPARILGAELIDGRTFGWLYSWEEVRLDGDPLSGTFGQYIRPAGVEGWLASAGDSSRLALNRYEAHLSVTHPQGGGAEGFANAGACLIPGALENCPPNRAAVPMLNPVPEGVVVELRAERTLLGETRFLFEAMVTAVLTDVAVPPGVA